MKRSILLYSGGLDSTLLLYKFKEEIKECIYVKYGSLHSKYELECAKYHTNKIGIPLRVINISEVFSNDNSSSLLNNKKDNKVESNNVVSFRNIILVTHILPYVKAQSCDKVLIGSNKSDYASFMDCRDTFYKAINSCLQLCDSFIIKVETPLIKLSKEDIINEAKAYKIVNTRTCYSDTVEPCGKCASCLGLKEGVS